MHLLQLLADSVVELNGADDTGGDHHSASLATNLMGTDDLVQEVVDDNQGLFLNGLRLALNKGTNLLGSLLLVKFRIRLNGLENLVVTLVRRVVSQHVHNEALLDSLLHGVLVEGFVTDLAIRAQHRRTKHLQRLVLRCGSEGVVIHIGGHLPAFDDLQDAVFDILFLALSIAGDNEVHVGRHRAALGTMGFIDNDSEVQISERTADGVQDELELVDGGNDNFLASLQGLSQRGRIFRPGNNVGKALERIDVVTDLLVQIDAVRNHNDGVYDILIILY